MVKVNRFSYLFVLLIFSSCSGWIPIGIDQTLGEQSKTEINSNPQQFKILDEAEYPLPYKRLGAIRDEILASGKVKHKDDFEWEIKIIEDDSVLNAFCLPGGYIYVYTGLIKYVGSEDGLAGIIGHEMAHADMRHATSQLMKNMGLSLLLKYIFGVDNSSLINIGAGLLSLSFSRGDESEADLKSVEYLYLTNYDARGASYFFDKLMKDKKDPETIEFISTHPNPENRVETILEKWKELGGKKSENKNSEYKRLVEALP